MRAWLPLARAGLGITALGGALALVTWRQARALEVFSALDGVRSETSLADAEIVELQRRIQVLESRARIVPIARDRLGLHTPATDEMVFLSLEVGL